MTVRERVLVFDFDGTVSLGDGPVRSYARFVAESLSPADRANFLDEVDAGLLGETTLGVNPIDGYDLVRLLSQRHDVSLENHSRAYDLSRGELATEHAPVVAPEGLAAFLGTVRESARLVLATNAPATNIAEALDVLGLDDLFDAVYTSVGKPLGFETILDELLEGVPDAATAMLSIGDVWQNDLEPAYRRGASTALVGPRADPAATPTFRADSLEELYPALTSWLSSPASPPHRTTSSSPTLDRR
ncbi:HAD family hydrolase [Glaciihabitans sp. UYNi722]|uniref:HAD family hydrolase n=1 Tax=Glaciihabitans sp. UYNi722 TaxID=3156344 RepID=UPI0033962F8D